MRSIPLATVPVACLGAAFLGFFPEAFVGFSPFIILLALKHPLNDLRNVFQVFLSVG